MSGTRGTPGPATVVLADDHQSTTHGIRAFLEAAPGRPALRVVAEARDGREALAMVERWKPSALVTDLQMHGVNGLDLIKHVAAQCPDVRVVVCSMYDEMPFVCEAFRCGALGYVTKTAPLGCLRDAIRCTLDGRPYLSPPLTLYAVNAFAARMTGAKPSDPYATLTVQEREVFQRAASGMAYDDIAVAMGISPNTVEYHRRNLYAKLRLRSKEDLVRYALSRGLLLDERSRCGIRIATSTQPCPSPEPAGHHDGEATGNPP